MMAKKKEMDDVLETLNPAQCAAVTSPASVVQILAPPGSGKTKTLTTRVAYLLSHYEYKPWNIIVATFTVKAAKEMKERIGHLVGGGMESKLILGTFHSIARRYLVRYGHLIGIKKGFGIADSSDSMAIIKRVIKKRGLTINHYSARNRISSLKAKGTTLASYLSTAKPSYDAREFGTVFEEYEAELVKTNTLDYDDLLLRGIDLLRQHPACVSNVEVVLIDEFQDTNLVQFDLMRLFAAQRKRVTVVGDPDQSIYSFRSAEIENLQRMKRQYPETVVLNLEENYRSSGAILLSALAVIQQDRSRPDKALLPTHCVGTVPVLRALYSASDEAEWIVSEIKRSMAMTGNDLLSLNDYAILIRSAFLSRSIEAALNSAGIPYRMCGGHRFYDHSEVKILLDYLRVINFPDNNDTLARIVNVPPRRIGEKTIKGLLEEADAKKVTFFALIRDVVYSQTSPTTKLTKAAQNSLRSFLDIIHNARRKLAESDEFSFSLIDLVDDLMKKISYREYLKKSHPDDHETRLANVDELLAQISDISQHPTDISEEDSLPLIDGVEQEASTVVSDVLSNFLANTALTSDTGSTQQEAEKPKEQVSISTIHAAKGLEWPVVFVPGAYEGSIPHSRAENTDEERRLLYVAMTRAKALLYMSVPGQTSQGDCGATSQFLSCQSLKHHIDNKAPSLSYSVVKSISHILARPCPSETKVVDASQSLPSKNDDQWPLDGSRKPYKPSNWGQGGRNTGLADSAFSSKRRRIDPGAGNPSGATTGSYPSTTKGHPSPTPNVHFATSSLLSAASHLQSAASALPNHTPTNTTMRSPQAFSITNTTMPSGFISARTHLRDLEGLKQMAVKPTATDRKKATSLKPVGKENQQPVGLQSYFKRTLSGDIKPL